MYRENGKWHKDQLQAERKQVAHLTKGSDNLHFCYDAQGRPAMVDFNGAMYTYVLSLQGDVIGLIDSNNNLVVE